MKLSHLLPNWGEIFTSEKDMFETFADAHYAKSTELYSYGLDTIFGDEMVPMGPIGMNNKGLYLVMAETIQLSVEEEEISNYTGQTTTPLE